MTTHSNAPAARTYESTGSILNRNIGIYWRLMHKYRKSSEPWAHGMALRAKSALLPLLDLRHDARLGV